MRLHWIWSDNPADWAQWISAIATTLAALFTGLAAGFAGIYTLFTYRLMRFTALTARTAVEEIQRDRVARLVPLLNVMDTLRTAVNGIHSDSSLSDLARMAAVLAEERLNLAARIDVARYLFDDRNHVALNAQKSVEATNRSVQVALADRHDTQLMQQAFAAAVQATSALSEATACIEQEIAKCRRGPIKAAWL